MSFGIVATAAATLGGAALASRSASKAANMQADATGKAISEQRRQYDLAREDFAPYREVGKNALGDFARESGILPRWDEVVNDPGYEFGLNQGQQAIDRKIAAGGGRVSGAAIKAAGRFGTDYASVGYGAAYQRRQDRLNRLASLAGIGQSSTAASALTGQNSANQISGLLSSQGDAAGAAQLYKGNVWQNAGNSIAAQFGRGGFGASDPRSSFRADDPYRNAGYFGGSEGE